jgi:glycosyltransferase-like protein
MFTYSTKPRGSVVHAASLAEALTRAGHEVTLYALAKDGASFFRPLRCRVELFVADEAPSDKAALIRQRVEEFARGFGTRPVAHDIFHAQDCLAASALLAGPSPRRSCIARTVHHVDRFDDAYLAACQRRSILEADLVFSVSRMTQREVLESFGRETRLVHNGVDRDRFAAPRQRGGDSLRAQFGIAREDTLILSVGGVEPRKNSRRCLAAVARLFGKFPRIAWVIAGGESIWNHGEYQAAFEKDLSALPPALARRIVRAGSVSDEDLTALYRTSDVLLCPSLHEGFGLCVLEAMAARTSVLASAREPFTEYLTDRSAALVDPESVDEIAGQLAQLVFDSKGRAERVAIAANIATQFSWDSSAAIHAHHYETALHNIHGSSEPRAPTAERSSHA